MFQKMLQGGGGGKAIVVSGTQANSMDVNTSVYLGSRPVAVQIDKSGFYGEPIRTTHINVDDFIYTQSKEVNSGTIVDDKYITIQFTDTGFTYNQTFTGATTDMIYKAIVIQ